MLSSTIFRSQYPVFKVPRGRSVRAVVAARGLIIGTSAPRVGENPGLHGLYTFGPTMAPLVGLSHLYIRRSTGILADHAPEPDSTASDDPLRESLLRIQRDVSGLTCPSYITWCHLIRSGRDLYPPRRVWHKGRAMGGGRTTAPGNQSRSLGLRLRPATGRE